MSNNRASLTVDVPTFASNSTYLSSEQLAAIEARWKNATRGPWEANDGHISSPEGSIVWGTESVCMEEWDANFIAHSWEDVYNLISATRVVAAKLADAEKRAEQLEDEIRQRDAIFNIESEEQI
jgi:hypothetical protein